MFKKYPFEAQSGLFDCGVACFSMLIQYYHGYLPNEELRELLHTTKEGTTAYHIVEGAKKLGMDATGWRIPFEQLDSVMYPCIIHVVINQLPHYLVLYERNKKTKNFLVADPSSTIHHMSFEALKQIYDGIVITCYPNYPLPKVRKTSFFNFIIHTLIKYKKQMIKISIFSLLLFFFSLISMNSFSYFMKISTTSTLYHCFFLFLIIRILKSMIAYFRNRFLIQWSYEFDKTFTCDTFSNIILLPYENYRKYPTGDMVARLQDIIILQNHFGKIVLGIGMDGILCLGAGIYLYILNPSFFGIALLFICVYILLFLPYQKKYKYNLNELKRQESIYHSYMIEHITGFETIKGLSMEQNVIDKFNMEYQTYWNHLLHLQKKKNIQTFLTGIINDGFDLLFLTIGSYFILTKQIVIGNWMTCYLVFYYFLSPIQHLVEEGLSIRELITAWKRLQIFKTKKSEKKWLKKNDGNINIKHLNHINQQERPVLKDINLSLKTGDKVLLVGESGCGKSTLLKRIKGYYQIPYTDILYLSQNESLFTGTLYQNLTLEQEIPIKKVEEVIDLCEITPIIKNSSLGLYFLIEENGFNLSGGEKERIIIARALLKEWNILLIDEEMSQMDCALERKICKRIFRRWKDKTIIMVSHRLDNMDLFDKVIYMKQGQIIKIVEKNS